jgi:apolipoprotein N-acyltransferase
VASGPAMTGLAMMGESVEGGRTGDERRAVPSRRRWGTRGAAMASGVLFALAFPPLPFMVLAFCCLVPLTVCIARAADGGQPANDSAWLGAWFAATGFGLGLYWIAIALSLYTSFSFLAYFATIVGFALLVAGTTATMHVGRRLTHWPMAVLLPITWVAFEIVLQYLSDIAFPWFPLGLAVATHPVLAQAADIAGVHGLSVWIAATNGLLVDAWLALAGLRGREERRKQKGEGATDARARAAGADAPERRRTWRVVARPLAIVLVLAVTVWGYGVWRLRSLRLRPLARVGIVQPNIPEDEKMERVWSRFLDPLTSLTRREEAKGPAPQLVVWPETALPDFLIYHPDWTDSLRTLAQTGHAPILFGLIDYTITGPGPSDFEYYNAASFVDSAGRIGVQPAYHKEYLVPIVERVPFLNPRWFAGHKHLDALLKYFGGFGRGTSAVPFTFPFGRVGVLICYESIFPQHAREFRRNGADLIVNITNDAWFGRSLAVYQHEAHLRLRAIETRVGIVRAANTGISEYIDPLGRPHGATQLFVPATEVYDAQTTSYRPLDVRWGDWLGFACLILATGILAVRVIQGIRTPNP